MGRLASMIQEPVSKPTDADLLRLRELTAETEQAERTLGQLIETDVAAVNRAVGGVPHIVAEGGQ